FSGDKSQAPDIQRKFFIKNDDLKFKNNSLLRWTASKKIYKIDFLTGDSLFLLDKPGWKGAVAVLSKIDNFIVTSHYLINLDNNQIIDIEKFSGISPENTIGCSFSGPSFNPHYPEILFNQSCEDEDRVILERVSIFNYSLNEFIILDEILNLSNCNVANYHPNGNIISLISENRIYIIYREK
ncbi:MAG: hypothetical protein U9N54_07040, partial [candidate division Zixibacteria bacterium]|nr:hypothetical protein [candidate division Zixibacteria bacterium]